MQTRLFVICLFAAVPLLMPSGCGSESTPATTISIGSGNQGGATTSGDNPGGMGTGGQLAAGGEAAGGSGASGTGGSPGCGGVYTYECASCMEAICCDQIANCIANPTCASCIFTHEASCDIPPVANLLADLFNCSEQFCKDSCFAPIPPYSCNPVNNAGCDRGAGYACAADWVNNAFSCQAQVGSQLLCNPCGPTNGWCAPNYECIGSQCLKRCCDNGDCGSSGSCDKTVFAPIGAGEVGLCMDSASPSQADCSDVPDTAPSNGSCVPYNAGQGGGS